MNNPDDDQNLFQEVAFVANFAIALKSEKLKKPLTDRFSATVMMPEEDDGCKCATKTREYTVIHLNRILEGIAMSINEDTHVFEGTFRNEWDFYNDNGSMRLIKCSINLRKGRTLTNIETFCQKLIEVFKAEVNLPMNVGKIAIGKTKNLYTKSYGMNDAVHEEQFRLAMELFKDIYPRKDPGQYADDELIGWAQSVLNRARK